MLGLCIANELKVLFFYYHINLSQQVESSFCQGYSVEVLSSRPQRSWKHEKDLLALSTAMARNNWKFQSVRNKTTSFSSVEMEKKINTATRRNCYQKCDDLAEVSQILFSQGAAWISSDLLCELTFSRMMKLKGMWEFKRRLFLGT